MPYNNTPIAPSEEITGTVSLPRMSNLILTCRHSPLCYRHYRTRRPSKIHLDISNISLLSRSREENHSPGRRYQQLLEQRRLRYHRRY